MINIYDKKGNEIICDDSQVEQMLNAGYTKEKPIIKTTKTIENPEKIEKNTKKFTKSNKPKDIVLE